jgi:hypothetical protein
VPISDLELAGSFLQLLKSIITAMTQIVARKHFISAVSDLDINRLKNVASRDYGNICPGLSYGDRRFGKSGCLFALDQTRRALEVFNP